MIRDALLITCEHAGNRIPREYADLFRNAKGVLATHRGYDLGIQSVARQAASLLDVALMEHDVSRLLVDVNRSLHNPAVFSEFTRSLARAEKQAVVDRYYSPHREAVAAAVREAAVKRRVLHLAFHSFTPVLNGVKRDFELGLLYDPSRKGEKVFCRELADAVAGIEPRWGIRMNRPYRGTADGLTTLLRTRFPASRYLGIEIEVNQALLGKTSGRAKAATVLAQAVRAAHS